MQHIRTVQPLSWEAIQKWSHAGMAAASPHVGYQPKVLTCTFGAATPMEGIRKSSMAHQLAKAMTPCGGRPGRMVVVDGTV